REGTLDSATAEGVSCTQDSDCGPLWADPAHPAGDPTHPTRDRFCFLTGEGTSKACTGLSMAVVPACVSGLATVDGASCRTDRLCAADGYCKLYACAKQVSSASECQDPLSMSGLLYCPIEAALAILEATGGIPQCFKACSSTTPGSCSDIPGSVCEDGLC